jgi:MFS family permease
MVGPCFICSITTKWWVFVISYGIIFPIGVGLQFFVNINTVWEWFPENKGLVGGTMIGGYGLGVFFFGIITTGIANPNNLAT